MSHLLIIDVSAIFYRCHHAMGHLKRAKDSMSTGGLLGYCEALTRHARKASSLGYTHALAAMDPTAPKTFRHELASSTYKVGRAKAKEISQPRAYLDSVPGMFGIHREQHPMFEADDIIATAAGIANNRGWKVTIIGADKDLFQIIKPGIEMIGTDGKSWNAESVKAKFGVPPEQMVELQVLTGDATDGIEGIRGVGAGKAAMLLERFGTADDAVDAASDERSSTITPALRAALAGADLWLTRKLVTLRTDVPLSVDIEAMAISRPDFGRIGRFCDLMEFKTFAMEVERWAKEVPW